MAATAQRVLPQPLSRCLPVSSSGSGSLPGSLAGSPSGFLPRPAHRSFEERCDAAPRHEPLLSWDKGGEPAPFRIWRGRSGRRYVVSIQPAHLVEWQGMEDAVVLAVRAEGGEHRLLATCEGLDAGAFCTWAMAMAQCGVTEFHVHWLAGSRAAREAVRRDLRV